MCVIPPLPAIGLAMPWQAPTEWTIFLLLMLVMAGAALSVRFVPRRWRRWERQRSPLAYTVQRAMYLCGVSAFALILLVVQPADHALYVWDVGASAAYDAPLSLLYPAPQSITCSHVIDAMYQVGSDRINAIFIVALVLVAVELLLFGVLLLLFPPQRIEAAGPSPVVSVPQQ